RLMQIDRDAAEGVAPIRHRAVEVGMGDRNLVDTALRLQSGDCVVGDKADALPQDVAGIRFQQQRALVDREGGIETDREKAVFGLEPERVLQGKFIARRPVLSPPTDVLAFIFADRAAIGWRYRLRELRTAGFADEAGHGLLPNRTLLAS